MIAGTAPPMRLGYLVPEFPAQTHVFFWREIRALRRLGVEVTLLSTRQPPPGACPHDFRDEAVRSTTYLVPPAPLAVARGLAASPRGALRAASSLREMEGTLGQRARLPFLLAAGSQLADLARRRRLDHVHVHSCANAAMVAFFAHRISGLPYSLTLHGPLGYWGPNQRQKWRDAAFAVVITRKLRAEVERDLAGALPPQIVVAPMGVDLERFGRDGAYGAWDERGPARIFSCGRLHPGKAHDDLIRAVHLLRARGIAATLAIAGEDLDSGDGSYRRELEALVRGLGLEDHVALLGSASEDRVRDELSRAHVFALASLEEALGVAIMEAMAMRLPVVATDTGGVREIVEDGVNGVLVPPRDPEALARGLARVLRDGALAGRLSSGAGTTAPRYSSEVSARAIVAAVANATAARRLATASPRES